MPDDPLLIRKNQVLLDAERATEGAQNSINADDFAKLSAAHRYWLRNDGYQDFRLFVEHTVITVGIPTVNLDVERYMGFGGHQELPGGTLDECVAIDCHFDSAIMFNYSFRDAVLWNSSFNKSLLFGANFSGADCEGASFKEANLPRASFRGASLISADFGNADLTGADLRGADLEGANLEGADLSYARLDDTVLVGANLKDTVLKGVTLVGAYFADLGGTVGDNYSYLFRDKTLPPFDEEKETHKIIKIFYGTDRKRSEKRTHPLWYYLNEPTEPSKLFTGYCLVKMPESRAIGGFEPFSIRLTELEEKRFEKELASAIRLADKPEVLIFIHGYNVKFAAAIQRFAPVIQDVGFAGVPILYSWSSRGKSGEYDTDAAAVELAHRTLSLLLQKISENKNIKRVHIMSHSMGGRALLELLEKAQEKFSGQIIFCAPDVGAQKFRQDLPLNPAERVSLYASSRDLALRLSARLKKMERAGQVKDKVPLVVKKGADTLDASYVSDKPYGHSYFAASRPVLEDCGLLIRESFSPERRNLTPKTSTDGLPYWMFRK